MPDVKSRGERPLRIVVLSPAHPLRGGIAASTERLAYALEEGGHEVIIYSFSLQYPKMLFPGKTQYSSDPAPEKLDIRTKINSINPFNWIKTGLEVKKLNPDVILARYWLPFMAPCLGTIMRLGKSKKTVNIALADNIIPHEKRPGDRLLTRYFVNTTDAFIVMSRSVEEEVRSFTSRKPVLYIPHPIYDNYGKPVPRKEALQHLGLEDGISYLLFFGFIRDYKGLDLLLHAMAKPKVKSLPLKLIVAGEFYGNEEYYKRIIEEEGISGKLILHSDFIPSENVKYYFSAADLVVQPYKTATQSGISQMAYHFEKPMIVTNVGGLPEIVAHGKAGYVVEPTAEDVAEAISDFFTHHRQESYRQQVKEEKKRFSWEKMVEGVVKLADLK